LRGEKGVAVGNPFLPPPNDYHSYKDAVFCFFWNILFFGSPLEEIEPGYSYNTKQTLVVEREVLHQINGWDEKFRSRVHSELFLRLNPVCSILGLPVVTYQLTAHDGVRVSRDVTLRQESFQRLVRKHESIFKAHPKMFASFVYDHALKSYELGQRRAALFNLCWAMQIAPFHTFNQFVPQCHQSLLKKLLVE
ncbi:MAG: hypothetical protein KME38_18290, partial [Spirirestis rafaelensis WJT71-NPBG6]|jgi:hypothetical protein|nr:hypothetical protein [Spirirestis rafaelensis WJT71-NPBG6]